MSPPDPPSIDADRVRRLFARPHREAGDDFLVREVARRLAERLAPINLDVARILDLGCGAGADVAALGERYDGAAYYGIDLASERLSRPAAASSVLARWLRRRAAPVRVQADYAALPFARQSFDLLWSNLALHWNARPHLVLPEWSRVARVGGLVAFSAFGPDTLREVVDAFAGVDGDRHVLPFTDMHDYGDMLVASGFTTPVVDMERLTLTYSSAAGLWADVRALGGNALQARSRGLHGRDYRRRLDAALDRTRDAEGRFVLTFELIFAHAWKGEPRTNGSGETIVRMPGRR